MGQRHSRRPEGLTGISSTRRSGGSDWSTTPGQMTLRFGPDRSPRIESPPAGLSGYRGLVDPRPLLCPPAWVDRVQKLHRLLLRALQGLLSRPRELLRHWPVTPEEVRQIEWVSDSPLHLGNLRPDFVIDAHGHPYICEINARFAYNGFLSSGWLDREFSLAYPEFGQACLVAQLPPLPHSTQIVKGREAGWDIHQLALEGGFPVVQPDQACSDRECTVLELHQDELLRFAALESLSQGRLVNDLRSIWIGHDKRLLGILAQPNVTRAWLGAEAESLAQAVLPTWALSEAPARVFCSGRDWVLKPNRLGKAEGIVFGSEVSLAHWRHALASAPQDWVVQPYIESLQLEGQSLVGTLLSCDETPLGLGIFRQASGPAVNVSGGGRVLFPMVDES